MGKHEITNDDNKYKSVKNTENNSKKAKKKTKKKKKHIFLKLLLIIIIILGIVVAKRLYDANGNILGAILGHNKETLKNLDKLQVLILGESTGMSDTIIVASYDPKTQEAALLTIPRDTFTGPDRASARYYHKINALYNYGETPEKTLAAVNEITGLDVKYYILVDTEALIELVDQIGGLQYNVPINMNYDDSTQNLHIHLTAGEHTLTGAQVEQLVRFRHNNDGTSYPYDYGNEDHGRTRTQRNVIIEIAKQSFKLKNITEISNIIDIFKEYVDTNMDLDSIKDYLPYASKMNMDNVKVGSLPGKDDVVNGIWFFFHDEEETKELVDELFRGGTDEKEENENNVASNNTAIEDD